MSDKEIFLHIGMPKCASSFLQQDFFPRMEDIHCVGAGRAGRGQSPLDCFYLDLIRIRQGHTPEFSDSRLRSLHEAVASIKERRILISYEGFAGSVVMDPASNHFELLCKYASWAFPQAKIILLIRKQDELFESLYHQRVKRGYYRSVQRFLGIGPHRFGPKSGHVSQFSINRYQIDTDSCDYLQILQTIQRHFGSKPFVFPYECIRLKRVETLSRLADYLGSSMPSLDKDKKIVNPSFSSLTIQLSRVANALILSTAKLLWPLMFISNLLGEFLTKWLRQAFSTERVKPRLVSLTEHRSPLVGLAARAMLLLRLGFKILTIHPDLFLSKLMRLKTRILHQIDSYLIGKDGYERADCIPSDIKDNILQSYSESNLAFANTTDINLKSLGYFN